MRRVIVSSILLLTAACAGPSDPAVTEHESDVASLVSSSPQVFVLGKADGRPAEPIVTFDHTCQSIHYVHTLRDSIVLFPDGSAVRTYRIDRFANQSPLDSSTGVARGTWSRMLNTQNVYYFNKAPSILLRLTPENSRATTYEMPMRVDSADELSNLAGMGGSCPGSPNDGREVEFRYTRR